MGCASHCHDDDRQGVPTRNPFRDFKIDIPPFDGDRVEDWIFKLEEFFDIAGTPIENRVKVASFHMVGAAYSWYKWLVRNQYTDDWNEFAEALRNRFGTDLYENLREALKELHQTGSVAEYQQQFEALSNKVHGLSESWIVSFFIVGLQDFLKCQLCLARPRSYPEAVALARLHEHNHLASSNHCMI